MWRPAASPTRSWACTPGGEPLSGRRRGRGLRRIRRQPGVEILTVHALDLEEVVGDGGQRGFPLGDNPAGRGVRFLFLLRRQLSSAGPTRGGLSRGSGPCTTVNIWRSLPACPARLSPRRACPPPVPSLSASRRS